MFDLVIYKDGKPESKEAKPPQGEVGWYDSNWSPLMGSLMPYTPDALTASKGAGIYTKMMRDDQVKAVVRFKQYGVVGRGFIFDKDPDNKEHEQMEELFMSITERVKGSWRDVMLGILTSMETGYSLTEKIFEPFDFENRTYWGLKALKLRPFNTISFVTDKHGNIEEVIQYINNGAEKVEMPLRKVVHMAYQPVMDEVYGESDLRACYRDYWCKDVIIKLRNVFLERFAGGLATVELSQAISPAAKEGIRTFLSNVTARSGAMFPEGAKLELHSPKSTDAFEKAIAACDKAIAKACLVPNLLGLSEQGQTGSYSQSQTQFEAFMLISDALAEQLSETLNEQVFKQLAIWNFGTEEFPRFKFEPFSNAQKMELAERWSELIDKGAAERTDEDENWIRSLLGAPDKPEEEETEDINPDTALNGQQVVALTGIVSDVAEGKYNKATAAQLIFHSFPVTLDEANTILKDVEEGSLKPDESDLPGEGDGDSDGDLPPKTPEGDDAPDGNLAPEGDDEKLAPPNAKDVNNKFIETLDEDYREIVKKMFADKPWLARVDYGSIEKMLTTNENKLVDDMTLTMQDVEASFVRQIERIVGDKSLSSVNPKAVETLKVQSNHKSALQRSIAKSMSKTGFESVSLAERELPKKRLASMEQTIKNYVASRSFTSVRKLVTDIETEITNIMLNAIEYDYSLPETIAAIQESSKLAGVWSATEAYRIESLARTLHSDIMNKARQEFFGKAKRDGFVQAYEYAAILDKRTTPVCESLHGLVRRDWAERTPPNHHQCRSILVAVTVQDPWDGKQDKLPGKKGNPHEGFGGEVT
jgi:SPP1 gp7 family putative phage head morphogenesis protein